jgi:hypothetical protein
MRGIMKAASTSHRPPAARAHCLPTVVVTPFTFVSLPRMTSSPPLDQSPEAPSWLFPAASDRVTNAGNLYGISAGGNPARERNEVERESHAMAVGRAKSKPRAGGAASTTVLRDRRCDGRARREDMSSGPWSMSMAPSCRCGFHAAAHGARRRAFRSESPTVGASIAFGGDPRDIVNSSSPRGDGVG